MTRQSLVDAQWRVEILHAHGRVEHSRPMRLRAALRLARSQTLPAHTQAQVVHVKRGWTLPLRWRR